MRVFWAILIVAGLAGLALLFVPLSNGTAETPVADESAQAAPPAPPAARQAAAPQPARTPEPRPESRPEPQPEPVATAQAQPTPEPVAEPTPEPVAEPAEVVEAPAEAPVEVASAPAEMPADREPLKDDPAAEVPVAGGPTPALGLEEAGDAMGKLLASLNAFGRAMGGDAGTDAAAETEIAADTEPEVASKSDTADTAEAAPSRTLDDAVQALSEQQTAAANEPAVATTPDEPAPSDTQPDDAQAQASLPIDATIQKDDGTLEIGGGEWVLPGDGTTAKPYIISWDLLQSAMQVYNPRLGKTELPEWAQKLEGKRVRIEGYVVLPLAQQSSNDVLLTLNQWDGCCIGVPPTPYDAIEVRLNGPVDAGPGAGMGPLYGSIEGDFKTDPYVAGGWLLGLYVLEEGKLTLMGRR
jgi:hypothetical protein